MSVPSGTTTSGFTNMGTGGHITPPYYADFMRENLYPSLYFRQLGTLVTIPRANGDKVKIPRWQSPITNTNGVTGLTGALTAVTENVTEGDTALTPGILCAESITGTVKQYIGVRRYSDKLIIITKANWIEGAIESMAREFAFKIDRATKSGISASSTLRIAGGSTKVGTATNLFGKEIARIAPFMDAFNVPRWEDETFVAVVNPLVQYDLFRDISANGFITVARYGDANRIWRGEVGQMYGIRFLFSTAINVVKGATGSTTATHGLSGGSTGSHAWVFAPDAFYSLELEDGGVQMLHMPPGSSGSLQDPGAQVGSVSTKLWYGVVGAPQTDRRLMRFAFGIGLHF